MSRITLFISAHGKEATHNINRKNKFPFALNTNNIKILNCGAGDSGAISLRTVKYKRAVLKTIKKCYFDLDKIQSTLKPSYENLLKKGKLTPFGKYICRNHTMYDTNTIKLYNPINDRMYDFSKSSLASVLFGMPMFKNNITLIRQMSNNCIAKTLMNVILGKTNTNQIKILKVEHYTGERFNNLFEIHRLYSDNNYKQIVEKYKESSVVQLSDIIYICELVGIKHVDIYEISCRAVDYDKITKDDLIRLNEEELCKNSIKMK